MREAVRLLANPLRLLRSRLYTNTAYLWLGEIAFALLGFAFWTVAARLYSPDAVGLAGVALSAILVLAQVSQLGLGYALIRAIPQSGHEAALLLSRSLVVVSAASVLIGVVFLSSLPMWSQDLKDLLWRPVAGGGFLVFAVFATVAGLFRFIFVAYQRADFVLAITMVIGALRLPLIALLGGLGSAMVIVAGHGLAVLAAILLAGLVFLPRCTGRLYLPLGLDVWRLAPLAPFALSNLVSQVLTVLVWQVLPLVVISLAGAEAAGHFYIGWAVAGVVLILTQQLALALFAEGSSARRGFGSQARGSLVLGVALGGVFAVVIYFMGDLVLRLFGREYVEQTSTVLKLLAAATPLAAVTYIYLGIERVRRRMVPLWAGSAVVAVVMVATTAVLVPRVGLAGAGYGVLAGYGVGALLSLILLYPFRRHGIEISAATEGGLQ